MKPTPPKHIEDIPTELTHQGTTHQKRLITTQENHRGDIATMNYACLEPGKQLTAHTHRDGEELYLFLEGMGEILIGDTWFPITKGSFATIPVGSTHSVKNNSTVNLTFITVRTVMRVTESIQ